MCIVHIYAERLLFFLVLSLAELLILSVFSSDRHSYRGVIDKKREGIVSSDGRVVVVVVVVVA